MGAADRPRRDPARRKTQPIPVQPPPPSKPTGAWTSSKILTKNSGIAKADIRAFLLSCITGWDDYSISEQRIIIGKLPPARQFFTTNSETGKLTCPLDADFIANDTYLKRAITNFTNDVSDGHYTPSWQLKARQAMKERAEGRFDEYMKQHTEDRFGGDDSSVTTTDPDTLQQPTSHNDEAEQGQPTVQDQVHESSDGEFDLSAVTARRARSRSRESSQGQGQGSKRKTISPDSSPDPIQEPIAKTSRTSTPIVPVVDQDWEQGVPG